MFAQEIRQLPAERHNQRHDEMRQCRHDATLGDLELEGVFEVLWLHDDEHVEAQAAREVSDDDRPDWCRREELLPRRL